LNQTNGNALIFENVPCVAVDTPHDSASVTDALPFGIDLFGQIVTDKKCCYCFEPLTGKQVWFCSQACRSSWHYLWEQAYTEKARRERIPAAVAFAERNPDIVYRISDWIKINMKRGRAASFRYYWERYRLYRQAINDPVYLNNNFEKTIKQLIINRFPELGEAIRMKEK